MKRPDLTRRMALEALVRTPDGAGGFAEAWAALGHHWVAVVPGAGREVAGEEVRQASVPCRIVLRGAPAGAPSRPVPGQRFRDGQRVFPILAVTEADPAGRYLTCFAREEGTP